MTRSRWILIIVFFLGMLTFAVGFFLVSVFGVSRRPTQNGIVEDYGSICFWYDDLGSMQASVSPKGCYSTTCTRPISKSGSVVIERPISNKHQIEICISRNLTFSAAMY